MERFVAVAGVEVEAVRTTSKDRWHMGSYRWPGLSASLASRSVQRTGLFTEARTRIGWPTLRSWRDSVNGPVGLNRGSPAVWGLYDEGLVTWAPSPTASRSERTERIGTKAGFRRRGHAEETAGGPRGRGKDRGKHTFSGEWPRRALGGMSGCGAGAHGGDLEAEVSLGGVDERAISATGTRRPTPQAGHKLGSFPVRRR